MNQVTLGSRQMGLKGKMVRIHRGPATVSGNEI